MKNFTLIIGALALSSIAPAWAHDHKTDTPAMQKCQMMKDGKKMDHSKMDHGKMDHSKMDHGKAKTE